MSDVWMPDRSISGGCREFSFQMFLNMFKRWSSFASMTPKQKLLLVPEKKGFQDHKHWLQTIGRKCDTVGDKFKSWEHLFTSTSQEMDKLGIKPQMRKYILGERNRYKEFGTVQRVEIPKRQEKYKRVKKVTALLRMQKLGLA
ncbi:IGR protein motif-domain-containing protein [Gorgonomyces haynaldii]|nr:IGR protein motif-domain-containing protein [Gorgonomyces haynaldii]